MSPAMAKDQGERKSRRLPVEYYDRYDGRVKHETIYGEGWLRWAYESFPGRLSVELAAKRAWFSRWYGWRMSRPKSRERIGPFIRKFGIDVEEMVKAPEEFTSFNDFFYRKLKPGSRPIAAPNDAIVFPADGRHLAFPDISKTDGFFAKGQRFDLETFLGDSQLANTYATGTLVLSRLCPVDYHRFHFCFGGVPEEPRLINGPLYSVSPLALRRSLRILWENKRVLTLLQTERCGQVIVAEIGATNVGSIHQTCTPGASVEKGSEKGYFAFGGSATLLLFEPGRVTLADDLVVQSAQGRELYARMGDTLGSLVAR